MTNFNNFLFRESELLGQWSISDMDQKKWTGTQWVKQC